jgi:hypothetical protein
MSKESTKEAAEALLRELPSVIGACVREDVYGHPREIHLLVRSGPNPRHLAYDVRDLLEERLGIPIDQRVISIAQLAPGKQPGPLLAGIAAGGAAPDTTQTSVEPAAFAEPAASVEPVDSAEPVTSDGPAAAVEADPTSHMEPSVEQETSAPVDEPDSVATAVSAGAAYTAREPDQAVGTSDAVEEPKEPRIQFTGITTESIDNRVRIRISLDLNGIEHTGEATGLDTSAARLRTCATATLKAVDTTCSGRARFEVEQISTVLAFEREYILVSAMVSSPFLGRRPIPLVGAQPVEVDAESAVALAALKAINRTLSLLLRLGDPVASRPRPRARH